MSYDGSAFKAVSWESKYLGAQPDFTTVVLFDLQWMMSLCLVWLYVKEKFFIDEKSGVKSTPKRDL